MKIPWLRQWLVIHVLLDFPLIFFSTPFCLVLFRQRRVTRVSRKNIPGSHSSEDSLLASISPGFIPASPESVLSLSILSSFAISRSLDRNPNPGLRNRNERMILHPKRENERRMKSGFKSCLLFHFLFFSSLLSLPLLSPIRVETESMTVRGSKSERISFSVESIQDLLDLGSPSYKTCLSPHKT